MLAALAGWARSETALRLVACSCIRPWRLTLKSHCLGLIGAQVYVRREGAIVDQHKRSIEDKESYRWLKGVETADQVLEEAAHVTHVQDREGDIYEQFAMPRAARSDLLIRIAQDRKLANGKTLFATMSEMPVVHRFRLTLKAQFGKRTARTAKLELRFGEVEIARPANMSVRAAPPQVTLRVVDVCESEKPIHWRLSTTHEVKDIEAALQIVGWYRLRWNIEQLFWVMKSQGVDIESSQLTTANALMKLAVVTARTACRRHATGPRPRRPGARGRSRPLRTRHLLGNTARQFTQANAELLRHSLRKQRPFFAAVRRRSCQSPSRKIPLPTSRISRQTESHTSHDQHNVLSLTEPVGRTHEMCS
jgi:hypothetical protein